MEYLIYRGKVRSFDTQTYLQVYVYVTLCHGSLQVIQIFEKDSYICNVLARRTKDLVGRITVNAVIFLLSKYSKLIC